MMKLIGVLRCVTAARRPSASALPATQVPASISQRSSGEVYRRRARATTNHPTRNGQSTVTYQAIPEEMS